jgi:predicted unusual protein kinase regulating ubiquinone biosynthesis (AarF/ABC1/UbiB family)
LAVPLERRSSANRVLFAGRLARRSAQIVFAGALALAHFGRQRWRLRHQGVEATPRALGRALVGLSTRLGATFIKVGQIASTRGDILPRPLVEELQRLQDRVPPFPFAVVQATVESELGRPLGSSPASRSRRRRSPRCTAPCCAPRARRSR